MTANTVRTFSKTAMSLEDFEMLNADHGGRCAMCGEDAHGAEPDARGYVCESCGTPAVFGAEEWLIEGMVA